MHYVYAINTMYNSIKWLLNCVIFGMYGWTVLVAAIQPPFLYYYGSKFCNLILSTSWIDLIKKWNYLVSGKLLY